jgi:hypothetical protein
MIFRKAVFDRHVLALDIAGLFETLMERGQQVHILVRRPAV